MKYLLLISTSLLLTGCIFTTGDHGEISMPGDWVTPNSIEKTNPENLTGWWKGFNDPILNQLVEHALIGSPDRKIAESRVLEARGLRRAATGSLFPQIGASANISQEKTASTGFDSGNLYDAGFDASYELDLFGRNRNTASASNSSFKAREADYRNVSLTLVSEVARTYTEFRAAQKQAVIASQNLESQQKTLDLVRRQKELGETPQIDVERSEGLVNTTKSAIPEFVRQADNARLRLSVLTGEMPEKIAPVLQGDAPDAQIDTIKPLLLTPAQIIAQRPDIQAAQYDLEAQTSLTKAEIANIFPTISIAGLFGVGDSPLMDSTVIWSGGIKAAVSLLDFGRIRGQIYASKAREDQAFQQWRKTVLSAVTDVEKALTDYARISERLVTLQKAAANAKNALDLSQQLYTEGEISFLDVLDAQRTLNNANSEVVGAEEDSTLSLIALYKSLGVY